MEIKTLATVALMMISGLLFGRLCKFIKLPNVTGYLIAGLVFGPSLFNIVDQNMIDEFAIISDIALSFIAFPSVAISALTILKGRQRTHNSCYF